MRHNHLRQAQHQPVAMQCRQGLEDVLLSLCHADVDAIELVPLGPGALVYAVDGHVQYYCWYCVC